MNLRIETDSLKRAIENIKISFPELAEDDDSWLLTLESETDFIGVMRRLEVRRQEADTVAEAIAANIDALRARMARFERRDQAIRELMFKMLQAAHLRKLEMPEATLSVRLGVPKVIVTDEAALPDEFCRIKREPDKAKIKQALAELQSVPGATLSNAEDTIAIRVK